MPGLLDTPADDFYLHHHETSGKNINNGQYGYGSNSCNSYNGYGHNSYNSYKGSNSFNSYNKGSGRLNRKNFYPRKSVNDYNKAISSATNLTKPRNNWAKTTNLGQTKKKTKVINIVNNYGAPKKQTKDLGTQTPPKGVELTEFPEPSLFDRNPVSWVNILELNRKMVELTDDAYDKIRSFSDLQPDDEDFETRDDFCRKNLDVLFKN